MSKATLEQINVLEMGAAGDGVTDDTKPLQSALDIAAKTGNGVFLPSGIYAISTLVIPPHVTLCGMDGWSLDQNSGTVLKGIGRENNCLLDLSGGNGALLRAMTLMGDNQMKYGIYAARDQRSDKTDYFQMEDIKCTGFTEAGAYFENINNLCIHHCLFSENENGLSFSGTALKLLDSRCENNRGVGFFSHELTLSHAIGCRFMGNHTAGVMLTAAKGMLFNCDDFQKNGGAGLLLCAAPTKMHQGISVNGSTFRDNGLTGKDATAAQLSCDYIDGITILGNTFSAGQQKPHYGAYLQHLAASSMTANAMAGCAMEAIHTDANRDDVNIANNIT